MVVIPFDTLAYARRLEAVGFTAEQAEVQVEIMAETFIHNTDALVTRDYLDARLAETNGKIRLLFWGQGVILAAIVIPILRDTIF
jgi:hypothetical protein